MRGFSSYRYIQILLYFNITFCLLISFVWWKQNILEYLAMQLNRNLVIHLCRVKFQLLLIFHCISYLSPHPNIINFWKILSAGFKQAKDDWALEKAPPRQWLRSQAARVQGVFGQCFWKYGHFMVLCGGKSWTQISLRVCYSSEYSVVLSHVQFNYASIIHSGNSKL